MPVTFKWLNCKLWEQNGEVIDQSGGYIRE